MTRRKLLIASLVTTLAMGVVGVPPAAAEAGGGTFECVAFFPFYPGDTGATNCTGTARGVFRDGTTTVVCVPFCTYTMTINYDTTCAGGGVVGAFAGDITITNGGTFETPYTATMVFPEWAITTSSPVGAGDATLIPMPPIPTCAVPGSLNFELVGSLAFD